MSPYPDLATSRLRAADPAQHVASLHLDVQSILSRSVPEDTPRTTSRVRLLAVAAAATAVAGVAFGSFLSAEPAYAVQPLADGHYRVSFDFARLDDTSGMERDLRAAGISSAVVRQSATCTTPLQLMPAKVVQPELTESSGSRRTIVVAPSAMPEGAVLVVGLPPAGQGKNSAVLWGVAAGVPACVPLAVG